VIKNCCRSGCRVVTSWMSCMSWLMLQLVPLRYRDVSNVVVDVDVMSWMLRLML